MAVCQRGEVETARQEDGGRLCRRNWKKSRNKKDRKKLTSAGSKISAHGRVWPGLGRLLSKIIILSDQVFVNLEVGGHRRPTRPDKLNGFCLQLRR